VHPPERPAATDAAAWRHLILERSPLTGDENLAIADGFFQSAVPRRLRGVLQRYRLDRVAVLDVGCSYGQGLRFFGPGSAGVDTEEDCVRVARALGFDAHFASIDEEAIADVLPADRFDAVWCCDVLEHVAAPHTALIQIRRVLRARGLAFLRVPLIPRSRLFALAQRASFRWAFGWGHYGLGYEALDHVNAFTRETFEFTLERAGFRVVSHETTITARPRLRPVLDGLLRNSANTLLIVAEPVPDWDYPEAKCARELTQRGWAYRAPVRRA
jgi:SAM-dependent methyltransferase